MSRSLDDWTRANDGKQTVKPHLAYGPARPRKQTTPASFYWQFCPSAADMSDRDALMNGIGRSNQLSLRRMALMEKVEMRT